MRTDYLTERPKISKFSKLLTSTFTVTAQTFDAEQTASCKQKAVRLFCRAMIRLYLKDHGNREHGKRLGVL
jgi:hypothetical protein